MAPALSPTASRPRRTNWNNIAFSLGLPLLALLFALAVCAVILLLLGVNPFEAYAAMITGAFGTVSGITQSIAKATPLLLVGLGICIAFRASVINIGAEGQIILGAIAATLVLADVSHAGLACAAHSGHDCWRALLAGGVLGLHPWRV